MSVHIDITVPVFVFLLKLLMHFGRYSSSLHMPRILRGAPRISNIIYVASRNWQDGGCSTHRESREVDLSHMVNRGSSSKSSGHKERDSHETIAIGVAGKSVIWKRKSLLYYMIIYAITMCIYQSHRDMSQLMESVMEAAALKLASPISVEPCSSVAGFRGWSGSV